MKFIYFMCLFSIVGLVSACTNTQEKRETTKNLTPFNDFVPSFLSEIPDLEIESGKYFNHVAGKYMVNTFVDSLHPGAVYWKIKDLKENIMYQGHTLKGKKNGWWEVLNNKNMICNGHYISNKKSGFWRYYQLNGESHKIVYYKNDTLNGLAQEFNVENILLAEGNYVRGLKSDYWKYFYNNGKIKEQGYFNDGYKSGWWQSFDSSSNLIEEAAYSSNEISGYSKRYLKGVLTEEGELYNGVKRGTWKIYDEAGKLYKIMDHE